MVNEHLDVESHWFETPPFCFRWQHNREREREREKKAIDTEGREGKRT